MHHISRIFVFIFTSFIFHSLIERAKEFLFDRYYIGEATMFSVQSTRYCMELLIRRILSSKTIAQS